MTVRLLVVGTHGFLPRVGVEIGIPLPELRVLFRRGAVDERDVEGWLEAVCGEQVVVEGGVGVGVVLGEDFREEGADWV